MIVLQTFNYIPTSRHYPQLLLQNNSYQIDLISAFFQMHSTARVRNVKQKNKIIAKRKSHTYTNNKSNPPIPIAGVPTKLNLAPQRHAFVSCTANLQVK